MTKKLEDIIASLPPERQEVIQQEAQRLIDEEMTLQQLRQASALSQKKLSQTLKVNQAQVSKIEHKTDMYISTLRSFIKAMGGELEIIAHLPNHQPVRITQFEDLTLNDVFKKRPRSITRRLLSTKVRTKITSHSKGNSENL